jgi:hypothetical protein
LNFDAAPVSEDTPAGDGGPSQEEQQWKRMRSGDRPGLQNRRAAGNPATGGFDPHTLPPYLTGVTDVTKKRGSKRQQ